MNFIKDESGQVGGVIMFVVFLFVAGFFYILLGGIIQPWVDGFNSIVSNPSMHSSQNTRDMMDTIFRYWWVLPIFFILLGIIYAIKNATQTETSEAY